uniref:SLC26A/SulP transporter domain-containing protein n=1 Tax=Acrobeloides nanus TaxID=290746 RepID=A0A914CFK3_9BILA
MNQFEFEHVYQRVTKQTGIGYKISPSAIKSLTDPSKLNKENMFNKMYKFLPILAWLPKYKWKENLKYDIIGGFTNGIMLLPQGMAYASLAGVEPIYGVYSSFFSSLIYMFFGTSQHISVGTFAVASMMTGAVRYRLIPDSLQNGTIQDDCKNYPKLDLGYEVTPLMLTSALTLGVGLVQVSYIKFIC